MAFDTIVVSGANSSLPHGVPSDKPICRGDFITMDFGAVIDGYHSDMTRTVALGEVSEEQRFVYDTVLRAQRAALDVLKAGISGQDGDTAARRVIEEAGYGHAFGHATGHGVGVQIHEEPRLSQRNEKPLLAGQVVTVEPGIYLEGRFGVRIEDMVQLTADGCRNLTNCPKELLIL
jgi:Xaa-Pro aminopeptidase